MESYYDPLFDNKNKEEIVKQIAELRKIIKKKHRSIKQNVLDTEEMWEKQLSPIAEPLKKLVEEGEQIRHDRNIGDRKRKILYDDNETPLKRYANQPQQGKKRKSVHNSSFDEESTSDYEYDDAVSNSHTRKKLAIPFNEEMETNDDNGDQEPMESETVTNPRVQSLMDVYTSPESGQELLKTPEGKNFAKRYIEKEFKGKLAKEYFLKLINGGIKIDHTYGVRVEGDSWMIGNQPLEIDMDNLIINGKHYEGTRGLYELLFMNIPNEYIYSEEDLNTYSQILQDTNVHRANYSAMGKIKSNRGKKYKAIISKLANRNIDENDYMMTYSDQVNKTHSGQGLTLSGDQTSYIFWNDPNELVDRLKVIMASQQAGNTSHNNEINSILEELHELDREMLKNNGVSIVD